MFSAADQLINICFEGNGTLKLLFMRGVGGNLVVSKEQPMAGIELICDYKADKTYRDSFNRLAELVFGIHFEEWYLQGGWDDRYICHSFLMDNEIIANVSVSKLDVTIGGLHRQAIQIGTVMTHPDYRGRGLSAALMRHVLHLYEQECELFFLFANHSAIDFYPKFGFEAYRESMYRLAYRPAPKPEAASRLRKLDVSKADDWALIRRIVGSRRPVSGQFGVSGNQGIFLFHALHAFRELMHYSPEDEAVVVFRQEGDTLQVYDVASQGDMDPERLLSRIADERTASIHFHFTPDQFIGEAQGSPMDTDDDLLYIKANFAIENNAAFRVPALAHA